MKLEEKLISLRKANGLSQFNLAEKIGISRQSVSKWEAGASKPSTENLKTLAALYDVPLEYLLNEDDPGLASNPLFHIFSGQERESCFNE